MLNKKKTSVYLNLSVTKPQFQHLSFLLLREKHNALRLPVFFFFFSFFCQLYSGYQEFGAKNYFTDYRTTNTIQLFVPKKRNASGLFFFITRRSEGNSLLDKYSHLFICMAYFNDVQINRWLYLSSKEFPFAASVDLLFLIKSTMWDVFY